MPDPERAPDPDADPHSESRGGAADRPRPRPPVGPRQEPDVEVDADADVDVDVDVEPDGPPQPPGRPRRPPPRGIVLVALVLALIAALVVLVVLVVNRHSGGSSTASSSPTVNQQAALITRNDLANAFVAGATSDIVAVTTYDYRSLDTALSNGQSVTTGRYRTAFRSALTGSLAREARRVHRVQTFQVLDAGVGQMAADGSSAKVLVFGAQSVIDDTTGGRAQQTILTLTATIARQGNRYLVADLSAGVNAGLPAGTEGLRAAAEAGRTEVVAVLTLRHDHFDADYDTALAGALDPLRSTLSRQNAATRRRVTQGGYDLAGTVTAVAVEQASGSTLTLLVAATGTRTTGSTTTTVVDGRYRVTIVNVSGRWLTSAIDSVTAG